LNGGEVSAALSSASGYQTYNLSAVYGRTWGSGQFMLAAEHAHKSNLLSSERPDLYIADGPGQFAGNGALPRGIVNFGYYPNIRVGAGATAVYYAAAPNATSPAQLTANTQNTLGVWYDSTTVPQQTRNSVVGQVEQQVAPWAKVYGQGFYSYRNFAQYGANAGSTSFNATLNIPSTNPFFIPVPGVTTSETVILSMDRILGQQVSVGHEKSWQFVGGLQFDLPYDWQLDLSQLYSGTRNLRRRINGGLIGCAITGGPGCTGGPGEITGANGVYPGAVGQTDPRFAFNPFGANSQYVINRIWADLFQNNFYDVYLTAAKFDGRLFKAPGGDVRAAIGFEYQRDREGQHNYTTNATTPAREQGGASSYTELATTINSYIRTVYGEVVVPLVGPSNAMPFAQRLEVSGAVRYSDYSITGGSTTNPKFGVTWQPTSDLNIHGTYGTSFRINLTSADPNSVALLRAITNYADYRLGATTAVQRGGGNSSLQPETARTFTLGADYKPSQLPGLKFNLTYFNIRYSNIIDTPGSAIFSSVTAAQETVYGSYLTRRPSTVTPGASDTAFNAQVAALLASNFPPFATPFPAVGAVNMIVDGRSQNAGLLNSSGLDFAASYNWSNDMGNFNAGIVGSYFFKFDRSLVPGVAPIDRLDNIDFPTTYRLRGVAGWSKGGWSLNGAVNFTPSYRNTNISLTAPPKVSSYTTVDGNIAYDTGDNPPRELLRNIVFSLSAVNMFNAKPPFAVVTNQNYDSSYASQIGRTFTVQLTKRW
ncbi:MAG: TonB-dependent receptor, partial [Caulobacteraceae bacterium]